MSAIDFSEVKAGTYVKIGSDTCQSIWIDGVKAWEYRNPMTKYDWNPNDIVGKEVEVSGYGFTGSSFVNAKLNNVGESTFFIKSTGNYSYPVGQNRVTLRDEEYFFVTEINFREEVHGTQSTVVSVPMKFTREYKSIYLPYDHWCVNYSGIYDLSLKIHFGDTTEEIDLSDDDTGDITIDSSVASDTVTFEFVFTGSLTATREVKSMFLIVEYLEAYE